MPFSRKDGDFIVCNAISGRDFRLFMHMRTVCGLLVVQNKTLCSHELFSSCFPSNPDLADPKSKQLVSMFTVKESLIFEYTNSMDIVYEYRVNMV